MKRRTNFGTSFLRSVVAPPLARYVEFSLFRFCPSIARTSSPLPPARTAPSPPPPPRTPPQWLRRPPPPPPPSTAAAAAPIQIEREVTKQTMVPVDLLVDATPTANQHRSAGHRSSWTPPPSPTKLSAACRRHRPATVAAASTAVRCASSSSPLPSPPSHHRHPHRLPQCACASE
jgi:hypothetical protein